VDTVATAKIDGLPTVKIKKSDVGWAAIAAFVAAYDYWAIKNRHETLSSGFWRALRNPKSRWPAIAVCTGLYKHLMFPDFLPKTDPLWWLAERWHREAECREQH